MAAQSTIAVYPLDGTNRKFVVPYEYLARRFVTITLLGTDRKPLVLGTDFRFISANQIETTQAWGNTQGYANIEVRRETSATQRLVDFYDGSVLRSRDLNVSAIQTIHIAEEARNLAADTLAADDDGNLDARGRRLVNLSNAVNPQDAMPLGQFVEQVTEWSQSAFNQANRSQAEANRSAASADAAWASQRASKTSETNAKTSETNAKTSETNAKTSETNAKTSEIAAQTAHASKNAAAISATNAKDSEIAALQYRNEASNFVPANHLVKSSNLADIPNKSLARENLDVLQRGSVGTNLHDLVTLDCNSLVTAYPWSGQIPVILTATSPNAPPSAASGHIEQYLAGSGNAVQKWVSIDPLVGGIWWRSLRGGTWDEWARVTLSSDKRVAVMDFGTMGLNQRKVLPNPFGNDQAVFCTARAEVLIGGVWHATGFLWATGGYGTTAHAVDEGIVAQTGDIAVAYEYSYGSGGTYNGARQSNAPVRAIVHHIGGMLF